MKACHLIRWQIPSWSQEKPSWAVCARGQPGCKKYVFMFHKKSQKCESEKPERQMKGKQGLALRTAHCFWGWRLSLGVWGWEQQAWCSGLDREPATCHALFHWRTHCIHRSVRMHVYIYTHMHVCVCEHIYVYKYVSKYAACEPKPAAQMAPARPSGFTWSAQSPRAHRQPVRGFGTSVGVSNQAWRRRKPKWLHLRVCGWPELENWDFFYGVSLHTAFTVSCQSSPGREVDEREIGTVLSSADGDGNKWKLVECVVRANSYSNRLEVHIFPCKGNHCFLLMFLTPGPGLAGKRWGHVSEVWLHLKCQFSWCFGHFRLSSIWGRQHCLGGSSAKPGRSLEWRTVLSCLLRAAVNSGLVCGCLCSRCWSGATTFLGLGWGCEALLCDTCCSWHNRKHLFWYIINIII